jgi:phosphate-selective porin
MNPRPNCKGLFVALLLALALAALVAARANATPDDDATITYLKVFKSSYPEYTEIKISQSGATTYDIRQLSDASSPQPARISAPLVARIFDLAAKLHDFDGIDIEMHHRIANLGQKTFTYQHGAETHSVSFNYTLNEPASQLLAIFDDLARQQTDLSDLERTMRYDRLGVNDVLLQVEKDYDNKLFLQPDQFLPALDQLGADSHFIDIARERARNLAARIRASP